MPEKKPEIAAVTLENGYYAINLPYKDVINRPLTLFYLSKSNRIGVKRKILWEEEVKEFRKERVFPFPTVILEKDCELVENEYPVVQNTLLNLIAAASDSNRLGLSKSRRGHERGVLSSMLGILSILGAAALGSARASGETGGSGGGPPDSVIVDTLDVSTLVPMNAIKGDFLASAFSARSQAIGFHFAPTRDIEEAVFWNPSAIVMSPFSQMSTYTDFKRFLKSSLSLSLDKGFSVGVGFLFLNREERYSALLDSNRFFVPLKTREWGTFLSAAVKLRRNLSVGITYKYLSQTFQISRKVRQATAYYHGRPPEISRSFLIEETAPSFHDFDVSASVKLTPSMKAGLNLMNITNQKLSANRGNGRAQKASRAVGMGVSYQRRRLHIGSDFKLSEESDLHLAAGIDYMPVENARVHIGATSELQTFLVGIEYAYFNYTLNRSETFKTSHLAGLKVRF